MIITLICMLIPLSDSVALNLLLHPMILICCNHEWLCRCINFSECSVCRDHLESYTSDYTIQVLVGYCVVYIFMQTFMIPGTVFMSLLAGALFGVFRGVALVVFTATAGASSCYFLSKLIGRPLAAFLWPDKLSFFQAQVNTNHIWSTVWLLKILFSCTWFAWEPCIGGVLGVGSTSITASCARFSCKPCAW